MKRICFISNRYPNVLTPTRQVFVQRLVWAMADHGADCTVISPVPVNQYLRTYRQLPLETSESTPGGKEVRLLFPRYVSLGQRRLPLLGGTTRLTTALFVAAVRHALRSIERPDALYGHFFAPAGVCAARLGRELAVKSFAAFGESTPWSIENFGVAEMREELSSLQGVVSVSSANRTVLLDMDLVPDGKIKVFPNGVQTETFHPRNKTQARVKFGFPLDSFVVAYVGQFTERKGARRVAAAVDGLPEVKVAFAGSGDQPPVTRNALHVGKVAPADMPDFLSAADVFVLPTYNEGCSNALVEAMACGLPIVSSNLAFNSDILGADNAILVDPSDVGQIRNAIIQLRDAPHLREAMGAASIQRAHSLSVHQRAGNILRWMGG